MEKEKFDDYIYDILSDYEIYKGWYKGIDNTHVTFILDTAIPQATSESEVEIVELTYRVDIWSKSEDEQSMYYNDILKILRSEDFGWQKTMNDIEPDIQLYHTAIFVTKQIDDNDYIYI